MYERRECLGAVYCRYLQFRLGCHLTESPEPISAIGHLGQWLRAWLDGYLAGTYIITQERLNKACRIGHKVIGPILAETRCESTCLLGERSIGVKPIFRSDNLGSEGATNAGAAVTRSLDAVIVSVYDLMWANIFPTRPIYGTGAICREGCGIRTRRARSVKISSQ